MEPCCHSTLLCSKLTCKVSWFLTLTRILQYLHNLGTSFGNNKFSLKLYHIYYISLVHFTNILAQEGLGPKVDIESPYWISSLYPPSFPKKNFNECNCVHLVVLHGQADVFSLGSVELFLVEWFLTLTLIFLTIIA